MAAEHIQAIRGMNDILPEETLLWRHIENRLIKSLNQYGFSEIRTPILENTQLFCRTIGDATDIVEKEMYTFLDRNNTSITLRPEGTAGCVRAGLEHSLLYRQAQKLWYMGPMFRYEKPQKGRFRQFHQLGVEVFGIPGIAIELELLALCRNMWDNLNLSNAVQLEINTLGEPKERLQYRAELVSYFEKHIDILDEDSKRRLKQNPLRILDSKNLSMQECLQNAPKLINNLSVESRKYFDNLCENLNLFGINYKINPYLVRGLDYYGQTVFEWTTEHLGSQASICAGGRFDWLFSQLGKEDLPAIGFAIGLERLILLYQTLNLDLPNNKNADIFFIADDNAVTKALMLAESLRKNNNFTNLSIVTNTVGGSFKSQFKKADKSGAYLAIILGEEELLEKSVSIKFLRDTRTQERVSWENLPKFLGEIKCLFI